MAYTEEQLKAFATTLGQPKTPPELVDASLTHEPATVARDLNLSQRTGIDPALAGDYADSIARSDIQKAYDDLAVSAPRSHAWTSQDAYNMALMRDSMQQAQLIEGYLHQQKEEDAQDAEVADKGWAARTGDIATGAWVSSGSILPRTASGLFGAQRAFAEAFIEPAAKAALRAMGQTEATPISDWAKERQSYYGAMAEDLTKAAGEQLQAGGVTPGVVSGFQMLGQVGMMLAAPQAALPTMVASVMGEEYGASRDKGKGVVPSLAFGAGQAAIEYGTEKFAIGKFLDAAKNGKPLAKAAVEMAAKEIPGEQLATFFQDLNTAAVLNPEKPLAEFWAERPNAAMQTLVATLVGGGGAITISTAMDKIAGRMEKNVEALAGADDGARMDSLRAATAESSFTRLKDIIAAAESSSVRGLHDGKFREWIESVADGSDLAEVYVSGAVMRDMLSEAGVTGAQLQAALPGVAAQLGDARATNGEVRISLPELLSSSFDPALRDAILPHAKTDPNGMTYQESQGFYQTQVADLEKRAQQIAEETAPVLTREEFDAEQEMLTTEADIVAEGQAAVAELSAAAMEGTATPEQVAELATLQDLLDKPDALAQYFGKTITEEGPKVYDDYLAAHANVAEIRAQEVKTLREEVIASMREMNRFTDPVLSAYATPLTEFYLTQSAALGIAPSELRARLPVKFTAEALDGGYKQSTMGTHVVFEVAPNPANAELVAGWSALTQDQRNEVSNSIAAQIMPEALAAVGASGYVTPQIGGFMGETNTSLTLHVNEPEKAVDIAAVLGTALSQNSMVVVSDKPAPGLSPTGVVYITMPEGANFQEVDALYSRLWELERDGEKLVGGHTTVDGVMGILNFTNMSNDELADAIDAHLGGGYTVTQNEAFTAFPENKKEYDYDRNTAQTGNADPSGLAIQRDFSELRAKAGRLLADAIAAAPKSSTEASQQRAEVAAEIAEGQVPDVLSSDDLAALRKLWSIYTASEGSVAQLGSSAAKAASVDNANDVLDNLTEINEAVHGFDAPKVKDITRFREGMHDQVPKGSYAFEFTLGKRTAEVYVDPSDRSLQLNILNWGEGGGGSAVYKTLLDFARNNDFVFHPDVQGLSEAAFRRRLENVLSHALQTGRTDYFRLSSKQIEFIKQTTGVEIDWANWGKDPKKDVEQMLNASYNLTTTDYPELKNVYFDFTQGLFVDSRTGVSAASFAGYLATPTRDADVLPRKGKAGYSTAARAAFANTILRARSAETRRVVFDKAATFSMGQLPGAQRLLYQSAYHGSPFKFDKFSLDHMGRGEGAQAYGWGLYFAGRREVAEYYRNALKAPTEVTSWKAGTLRLIHKGEYQDYSPRDSSDQQQARALLSEDLLIAERDILQAYDEGGVSAAREAMLRVVEDRIESAKEEQPGIVRYLNIHKKYIAESLSFDVVKDEGQLYKVEIPEDDAYLLWDKPLSAQSEKVKAALRGAEHSTLRSLLAQREKRRGEMVADGLDTKVMDRHIEILKEDIDNDKLELGGDGNSHYKSLTIKLGSDEAASKYLHSLGINGIKYLDGSSRAKGEGAYNYVIFDDNAIQIVETYYQSGTTQPRGYYDPATLTISILQGADLSSVLHESGHFYLEALRTLASHSNAPQLMKDDWAKTLNWFGVADTATWDAMPLDQKRPYHEQWAQSQERWMLEGKAPTLEMQPVFARFRAWLLNVYKSLEEFLRQNPLAGRLDDDMRGVFSRLIASEEAIKEAERARGYAAMPQPDGVPDAEYAKYMALGEGATADAIENMQRRSVKDMQWMSNAKNKAIRKLQREADAKRKAIRAEVTAEVMAEPVNQARTFLRTGETTDPATGDLIKAEVGAKLNTAAVKELFPESALAAPNLAKLRGMTSPEGLHPDLVAQMFGYRSGEALVLDLIEAEKAEDKIVGMTDQRMLERHGELIDPAAVERAAESEIHNEARAKFMATGLQMLTKSQMPVREMVRAATEAAQNTVARKKIRDIKPKQFEAAEARANKKAIAEAPKEPAKAAEAQRAALLNNRMARAATDALDEVEKALRYVAKFQSEGTRKNLDLEYLEQIDALLAPFDMRSGASLKAIDKRKSLAEWIEKQEALGYEPAIDVDTAEEAKRKHYKDMTMEELRGLLDAVKSVEHLGRLKKKLLTAKDAREFAERIQEAISSIKANANREVLETATPSDVVGKVGKWWSSMLASHRKFASIIREMDGSQDNGVMWNLLVRSMNEAGDNETEMKAQATEKVAALFQPVMKRMGGMKDHLKAQRRVVPGTKLSMSYEERIMFAMNWGNEGNRQRLLGGGLSGKRALTPADAQAVLDTLDKADWDFVQGTLDFVGSYRDQIAAQEKRITGKEPKWIEAAPIVTKFGTYPGGYFPAKYDADLSTRSESLEAATNLRMGMKGAFGAAATRNGYTQRRAEEVTGRPMLLSFNAITTHVNEVVHRLAWQDWLFDANRVIRSLDGTVRDHYGAEILKEMRETVKDIAQGDAPATSPVEQAINRLRTGSTIVGMGWRVSTALLQPSGLAQSWVRVGGKWMAKGVAQYAADPFGTSKMVNEKSKLMRDRGRTMYREINEIMNTVRVGEKMTAVHASYFSMIAKMQRTVDIPTWLGAYEKAAASLKLENAGTAEARKALEEQCIALADQAVIDAQSGGQLKDLARVQRGSPIFKLFTNFYSYFSATYNLNIEAYRRTNFKSPTEVGMFAVDMLILNTLPVLFSVALKELLKGGCQDDDMECLASRVIHEQLSFLMGQMVLLREAGAAVEVATGGAGFGYKGPAGLRFFGDLYSAGQQVGQGDADLAAFKAVNSVTGAVLHYPAGQINSTVEGIIAVENGDVEGAAILPALIAGKPREEQ